MTATTAEVTTEAANMGFQPQNFIENLSHMGAGMLGIFVVIGIIVGITYLLNAVSRKK